MEKDKSELAFELSAIKDNILTYLGAAPKQIHDDDPHALEWLTLNLGKLLLWVSPHLDDHSTPRTVQEVTERANTVFALGEQFRLLGLRLIEGRKQQEQFGAKENERRLEELESYVAGLHSQFGEVGKKILKKMTKAGPLCLALCAALLFTGCGRPCHRRFFAVETRPVIVRAVVVHPHAVYLAKGGPR